MFFTPYRVYTMRLVALRASINWNYKFMSTPSPVSRPTLGLVEFVSLMALMTSLVALSIDAMLPALNTIAHDLNLVDEHDAHIIVSVFFAGMALGQLFFGPYSDARGRREAIVLGLGIFIVGTIVCMLATDMTTMIIGRLIQAFGVSGPRIASMAVIRDQFVGEGMARVMSFIMMVFILVPMIAPMVGQAVLTFFSWQHIFSLFLLVALLSGLWFLARQPETLPAENRKPFSWGQFFISSKFVLTHVSVIGPTLAMGCVFGSFLAYLSASQTIYAEFYGVGDLFPYIFALLAFSIGIASFVNGRIVTKMGMHTVSHYALIGAIVFAVVLNGLNLLYAGLPPLLLLLPVLFIGFFFVGLLFGNLNAMAMQPLGHMAGLGAAIIGSLSSIFAVPIAMIIDHFIVADLMPISVGFLFFYVVAYFALRKSRAASKLESAGH